MWPRQLFVNIMWVSGKLLILVLCLALFDVPIARLKYRNRLASKITPLRFQLQEEYAQKQCSTVIDDIMGCAKICHQVDLLSDVRQQVIEDVRNEHAVGRFAAEIFDWRRGQTQEQKMKKLEERSCTRKLQSIDHYNPSVSATAFFYAAISILGGWHTYASLLHAGVFGGRWWVGVALGSVAALSPGSLLLRSMGFGLLIISILEAVTRFIRLRLNGLLRNAP
eukprot:TRINITY_DN3702_c0_g1_i1.p1 TRINITY_DN3702_c0_g1~~TRINITY_DN3702_c0_g1_i1.p1  ORF type:complete len:230 (-),score=24.44 TRINITY_DN3702_c0_g1_i1:318-986(-)